jgi:hypothetical protein
MISSGVLGFGIQQLTPANANHADARQITQMRDGRELGWGLPRK